MANSEQDTSGYYVGGRDNSHPDGWFPERPADTRNFGQEERDLRHSGGKMEGHDRPTEK